MNEENGLPLDELMFFDGRPGALALYERLRGAILSEIGARRVEVFKTQISFKNRRLFAAVSFLPARRAADRPRDFITLTFGLRRRCLGFRAAFPQLIPSDCTVTGVLLGGY